MTEITRYYNESQAARRRACATTGELPPSAPQQSADPADIHVHQRTNTNGNACPDDGVGCAARGGHLQCELFSENASYERMLPAVSSGDDVGALAFEPPSVRFIDTGYTDSRVPSRQSKRQMPVIKEGVACRHKSCVSYRMCLNL